VPYRLARLGVVMRPDPMAAFEAEGVLNPGSGRSPDGRLWLLPRLVAAGNVSRLGLAEVVTDGGVPVGVRRDSVVLSPDAGWERGHHHGGVEDPRTTRIPALGPAPDDLCRVRSPRAQTRAGRVRGPADVAPSRTVHFTYQDELDTDLNLFPNKDVVYFPEPVPGPTAIPRTRCCTARCGTSA
jgi:hypothetical protein